MENLTVAQAQGQLALAARTLSAMCRKGGPTDAQIRAVARAADALDVAIAYAAHDRANRPCRTFIGRTRPAH